MHAGQIKSECEGFGKKAGEDINIGDAWEACVLFSLPVVMGSS